MSTRRRTAPFDEDVLGRSPLISVVQSTDVGDCDDLAQGSVGRSSVIRSVFAKGKMCARLMVIADMSRENPSEMRLIDDDDVIEALALDRPDQPVDVGILPRTGRSRDDVGDAKASDSPLEHLAIDAIAVSM